MRDRRRALPFSLQMSSTETPPGPPDIDPSAVQFADGNELMQAGRFAEAAAAEYKLPARYKDYRVVDFFGGIAGNIQTAYKELKK